MRPVRRLTSCLREEYPLRLRSTAQAKWSTWSDRPIPRHSGAVQQSSRPTGLISAHLALLGNLNTTGEAVTVTAQHCQGGPWYNSDGQTGSNDARAIGVGPQLVGNRYGEYVKIDAMDLHGGFSYGPYIYVGGTRSSSSLPVIYYSSPPRTQRVCEDGALSGETCNIEITGINMISNGGRGPGFFTKWDGDGYASAGSGDSGGPAETHMVVNGKTVAQLNGIITEADNSTGRPCRGYVGRGCYALIFNSKIGGDDGIDATLNLTPVTATSP